MTGVDAEDAGAIGFLLVRLWAENGAEPALRARLVAVLDVGTGEASSVLAAGRTQVLHEIDRLLAQFERLAPPPPA